MKRFALVPILIWTMSIYAIAADKPAADPSIMACDVGPISKTYGKTDWLVYSCKDAKSVIAVSAPGNPATPFFFILSPEDGGIRVYGEGNGDKSATKAAFNELESLTELDVANLVLESKEHASLAK